MKIGMVPARIGSTRLAKKNLALINGKPLISYTIEAAVKSGVFDKVIVNSDDKIFESIAKAYGADFYLRPEQLGTSSTKVDEVVMDFLNKFNPSYLAWVNPTSPLQTPKEIRDAFIYFLRNEYDSLVTVRDHKVHCVYNEKPINFTFNEVFGQTQDILPVRSFVYSVCAWKSDSFLKTYEQNGYGFFCGKTGYFPVSLESSFLVKDENDLKFIISYLSSMKKNSEFELKYYK